jgi:hypothetical protein
MSREFEMSMMGELQFFLGLQIKQSKEQTFVHQAKYTKDIVRKFKMEDSKDMTTPMSTTTALDADEEGEHVDQKEYRSMIGSLTLFDGDEAGHPVLGMSMRLFSSVSKDFTLASSEANFQVLVSHSRLLPLVLRVLFFGASWFFRRGFARCRLDRSPLLGHASFWGLLWCLGLHANSRVLLSPLPRQSKLPLLIVALSSFGFHTLCVILVRSIPMSHFNVIALVP